MNWQDQDGLGADMGGYPTNEASSPQGIAEKLLNRANDTRKCDYGSVDEELDREAAALLDQAREALAFVQRVTPREAHNAVLIDIVDEALAALGRTPGAGKEKR